MSSHYVYVIVNKINLKLYFGSHSWEGEGLDPNYYGSGTAIKRAVKKYGKDNFIVYPIKFYNSVEECRQAEEQLLKKYDIANNPYCYNLKNSAIGMTSEDVTDEIRNKISQALKGKTISEETRKKISQANKGKTLSDETRRKLSQANKGKTLSEEHKQKLSQAKKGENNPNYGKRGKDAPMYGKHHTEETRKKISQATKGENNPMYGKKFSEEYRQKISQANKGKTLSEEHKQKLSQAQNYKKTPLVAIDKNGKVKIFESKRECARKLNLNTGNIYNCLKGKCKTCKGYAFKYVEELESGIYEGFTGIAE